MFTDDYHMITKMSYSNTDQRISLMNKKTQLKQAEAKVKSLRKDRQRHGKGFFLPSHVTNCGFGTKKYLPILKTTRQKRCKGFLTNCGFGTKKHVPILKTTRKKRGKGFLTNCGFGAKRYPHIRQKRGKGWGNLAALGLSTAAKGVWGISKAGRQKRYRDQEALNKIRQDYYANHYHR